MRKAVARQANRIPKTTCGPALSPGLKIPQKSAFAAAMPPTATNIHTRLFESWLPFMDELVPEAGHVLNVRSCR